MRHACTMHAHLIMLFACTSHMCKCVCTGACAIFFSQLSLKFYALLNKVVDPLTWGFVTLLLTGCYIRCYNLGFLWKLTRNSILQKQFLTKNISFWKPNYSNTTKPFENQPSLICISYQVQTVQCRKISQIFW